MIRLLAVFLFWTCAAHAQLSIEITGAVDLIFWQFDVFYDASDVQIVTNCDPFSDPFCNFGGTGVTEGPFFGSLSPFNLFNPGFILLDSVTLAQLGQLIETSCTQEPANC